MLERQREGIAKAKAEGKFTGRKPTARAKSGEIIALAKQGMSKEKIAKTVGVGVASVYRVLHQHSRRPEHLRGKSYLCLPRRKREHRVPVPISSPKLRQPFQSCRNGS